MANEPDRRSILAEAFDKSEKEDEGGAAPEADELAAGTPEPELELDAGAEHQADEGAQAGAEEGTAEESAAAQKARDEKGRFAKEKAAAAKVKAAAGKKAVVADPAEAAGAAEGGDQAEGAPAAAAAAPTEKPPASWRPAAREQFAKLPAEVRSEVVRREKETSVALQRAAEAHKAAENSGRIVNAVQSVLAPFEPHIRARQTAAGEQYNPLRVVDSLLRTAHTLETAAPVEKAKVLAGFMRQYGVSVDVMNEVLGGQPAGEQPGQGAQPPQYRDPRVDELLAAQQRRDREIADQRTSYQQRLETESARELQEFGATHEYYEDVRDEMSVILSAATAKGRTMTLEDAYKQAVKMNPDVAPIVEQKEAAQKAKAKLAASQKARAAGSSLRSTPAARPAPAGGAQPDDRRSQIEALWEEQGQTRI